MYSPTSRLLTVLELLQSHRQMSGAELARRLEVDVRTIRRYITTLQDMGIPIEAERGAHGAYQLGRGYRLPPLMLTDAEAVALTLGLLAIREYRFPVDVAAVEGALAKIERVIPETLHQQAHGLQETITFNITPPPDPPANMLIVSLSSAVREHERVRITYQAFDGEITERDFDAYGIVYHDGYWYTAGYCHLRQDLRTFRVDRIVTLEPRRIPFDPPVQFDPLAHVLHALATTPADQLTRVLLKTSLEAAQAIIPPAMGLLEAVEEGVMFTPSANQVDWLAFLLLSLDIPVVVLESDRLRKSLKEIAERALTLAET